MDHFTNPAMSVKYQTLTGWASRQSSLRDIMKIYIKVKDNIIEDIKFKPSGAGRPSYQQHGHGNGKG